MGVYINMEMPECKSKPYDVPYIYHVIGDIICYPNGEAKLRILIDKTEHEYTLVPVPPHGRLGDLDALAEKAIMRSEKCGVSVNVLDKVITAYDIEIAPTVIQAKKEG